ncbi:keratin-associated protein 12-1-like [Sus scrofa]|uniref:Keratin-associated protein 12-1-like n=3 Tax=Sus scrofa TaxID=9823 RepID=A0A8D0SYZ4_PIG|nr:keratin-associated protein 12-1-like [Sus scrofa]
MLGRRDGNSHEEVTRCASALLGRPLPGYKGCPGRKPADITALLQTPAHPHTTMSYTSCSSGCQTACYVPSSCQPSSCTSSSCQASCVPVSYRKVVCVPVSCRPAVCVAPSCQSSGCLPVSCKPVVWVAPSCQSSGFCQPLRPSLVCRPLSCSTPSCF